MKKLLPLILLIAAFGCQSNPDRKLVLLDSLKKAYAGKEIHVNLTNNAAGVEPLTSKYAYTEKKGGDFVFELNTSQKYVVSESERDIFIPTIQNPTPVDPDMILIEIPNSIKRGFVSYKFIKEFNEVLLYDNGK